MKPLNIDKTGCSNISSNCVSWQGPDIECIGLCKGDSVTEVVYKLGLEVCSLMDTFDLTNYDLQCFSTGVCQPQTFKDFINILINKVCALQACNPNCGDSCNPCTPSLTEVGATTTSANMSTHVPIAREFQYKNPTGDLVTTMAVSDYAQAVGNKLSTLINSTKIVQDTLFSHSNRITALEKQGPPTFEMPTIVPVGVLAKEATSMQLVLAATEQQFTELKTALGNHSDIYTNLQKLDASINDAKSLSKPGTNVSSLKGFTVQPSNLADVLGNVFVMLSDMRNAMNTIMTNYIPNTCDAISLDLTATFRSGQIVIYIQGTLPASSFMNTSGTGTQFTITDTNGNLVSYIIDIFSIINVAAGYSIDVTNTRLNTSSNLSITANPSFTNRITDSVCKSSLQYTLVNVGICPSVMYYPLDNEIGFTFNSSGAMQAYTIELYNSSGTDLLLSQTFVSNVVQGLAGKFEGLLSRTLYKARVKIVVNGITTPCEFVSITTI